MANHEIVPTSAFTKGTAERKKSTTSFSLPSFASSGTYSANFVITFSCSEGGHQAQRPATHISHPRHCPLSPASLSQSTLVKAEDAPRSGETARISSGQIGVICVPSFNVIVPTDLPASVSVILTF